MHIKTSAQHQLRSEFMFPVSKSTPSTELERRVEITYNSMGYRNLQDVKCRCAGSHLTLTGKTSTFYLKQVAQVIAAKVAGVDTIENQIEVSN